MKDKKILVVATTDNMIWQFLIPHIKHMQALGNSVECACSKTGFWFDELANKFNLPMHEINFTRHPFSLDNIKGFKSLCKLQKENNYTLVYCQQPVGGVMGRKLGKKFKIPVIFTAHGFHFFKGNNKLKNLIFKPIERYYSRYATALITMNEEDYQASKNWKAKAVYKINGIGYDCNKYSSEKVNIEEFKASLGIKDEFIILTVAEYIKRKNYNTMLKTIAELKNENIKFVVCGTGRDEEIIKEQIKQLGIEDKVLLLGYRKDIDKIMQISDVFFLASHQEGLTLSVIEAMNFSLPCVVSDVRGNRDLVDNEKGGFVCPQNDEKEFASKIKLLIENKALRSAMGGYNKKLSEKYGIENVKKQLEEIYKTVE